MDTLHTVMRSIRGETKTRRDHLSVFREFLDHLDRVTRQRAGRDHAARSAKPNGKTRWAAATARDKPNIVPRTHSAPSPACGGGVGRG